MRLVLLGPPGAGKGTQAVTIASTFGIPHIATGDIFRANVREETPLGKAANDYMARGDLVPDEIVNDMVADRLAAPDTGNGFLLDGYPRTVPQAETLEASLAATDTRLDGVLHFVVPDDELRRRIAKRRAEQDRADDADGAYRRRVQEYRNQTADLIPFFRDRGLLHDIDAVGRVEDVAARTLAACRAAVGTSA